MERIKMRMRGKVLKLFNYGRFCLEDVYKSLAVEAFGHLVARRLSCLTHR